MQNTSHAVMAQRVEPKDSLDDFPTPPWASRALTRHVLPNSETLRNMSCLEPACGGGHMAKPLSESFGTVSAADIADYGYGRVQDFLSPHAIEPVDWIITNPPFRLAENFLHKSLGIVSVGVAVLVRTVFLESVGRYERLFQKCPPTIVAQFAERVPMVKGRLDPKASTATAYAWFVWIQGYEVPTQLVWIPPCRKELEQPDDYPT